MGFASPYSMWQVSGYRWGASECEPRCASAAPHPSAFQDWHPLRTKLLEKSEAGSSPSQFSQFSGTGFPDDNGAQQRDERWGRLHYLLAPVRAPEAAHRFGWPHHCERRPHSTGREFLEHWSCPKTGRLFRRLPLPPPACLLRGTLRPATHSVMTEAWDRASLHLALSSIAASSGLHQADGRAHTSAPAAALASGRRSLVEFETALELLARANQWRREAQREQSSLLRPQACLLVCQLRPPLLPDVDVLRGIGQWRGQDLPALIAQRLLHRHRTVSFPRTCVSPRRTCHRARSLRPRCAWRRHMRGFLAGFPAPLQ